MRRCTNFTRNRRNLEANNAGNGPRRKLALSGQRSGTGGNERQKGKRREAEAARLFYCRVVRRGRSIKSARGIYGGNEGQVWEEPKVGAKTTKAGTKERA